jgi:hypothetical protein
MDQILFGKFLDFSLKIWDGIYRHFSLRNQNFITEAPTNQKISKYGITGHSPNRVDREERTMGAGRSGQVL